MAVCEPAILFLRVLASIFQNQQWFSFVFVLLLFLFLLGLHAQFCSNFFQKLVFLVYSLPLIPKFFFPNACLFFLPKLLPRFLFLQHLLNKTLFQTLSLEALQL